MDTILCAFNCSAAAPCSEWAANELQTEHQIITIPGATSTAFQHEGERLVHVGMEQYLNRLGKPAATRVAVVTFSAGWAFTHALLQDDETANWISAIILLDGLHRLDVEHWASFGAEACRDDRLLAMFHSQIVPPNYPSTRETNKKVFHTAVQMVEADREDGDEVPDYIACNPLPTPIRYGNKYGYQTFAKDPIYSASRVGSLHRYEYAGKNAAIHIYIAMQTQRLAWKLLGEFWNATSCEPSADGV